MRPEPSKVSRLEDVDLDTGVTQLPPLRPVGSALIACTPLAVVVTLVGLLFTGATTQTPRPRSATETVNGRHPSPGFPGAAGVPFDQSENRVR